MPAATPRSLVRTAGSSVRAPSIPATRPAAIVQATTFYDDSCLDRVPAVLNVGYEFQAEGAVPGGQIPGRWGCSWAQTNGGQQEAVLRSFSTASTATSPNSPAPSKP